MDRAETCQKKSNKKKKKENRKKEKKRKKERKRTRRIFSQYGPKQTSSITYMSCSRMQPDVRKNKKVNLATEVECETDQQR